jgi:hypothetical protein
MMPIGFGIEYGPKAYNIIHLLKYFQKKNMTLINVGDSISLQLVRAIVYECARLYGDEVTVLPSINLPYTDIHRRYYEFSIYHKEHLIVTFFHVRHYECQSGDAVLKKAINSLQQKYYYEHFVIVFNVGLHCHNKEQYRKVLRLTFEFIENAPWNMTFFYKQTSYQHFETITGEYNHTLFAMNNSNIAANITDNNSSTYNHTSTVNTRVCIPHNYSHPPIYEEVEDSEIDLANQRYTLSNQTIRPINVLPFRYTSELWDLHRNSDQIFDCTHFKEYSPIIHQPIFYTLYQYFLSSSSPLEHVDNINISYD